MTPCNNCKEQRRVQIGLKGSFFMACRLSEKPCIKSLLLDGKCGQVKKGKK